MISEMGSSNFKLLLFFYLCLWEYVKTEEIKTDVVRGQNAELPCNVTPEEPNSNLTVLAWYRDDSSSAFYSHDMRYGDNGEIAVEGPQGRYGLIRAEDDGYVYLLIREVQASDAGRYHCFVDFDSSRDQKTYIQLNVIEPPEHLWVIHENGSLVVSADSSSNASENIGPYYIGDTIRLFCVSFGGSPRATLTWSVGDEIVKDTSTPISEQRTRSDLEHGPLSSEDHGLVLSCEARNNDVTPPLAIDVIVDMHLPPELITVRDISTSSDPRLPMVGEGRTQEGQTLRLQCRVFGARPTPKISWRLNDEELDLEQAITVEQKQRLVVSEIKIRMDHTYDETRITCCVPAHKRSEDAYACAPALPITVSYAPVVNITVDGALSVDDADKNKYTVLKNSNISIKCNFEAHPSSPIHVSWFHVDRKENIDTDDKYRSPTEPIISLENVTEEDAGEYVCSVENEVGNTFGEPVNIDVAYHPYCIDETIQDYGVGENEFVNITCKVKGSPVASLYRWVIVNEKVNLTTVTKDTQMTLKETESDTLLFQRPNDTEIVTVFCNGINNVEAPDQPQSCVFWVTDKTFPLPPTDCEGVKSESGDITISCTEGHDGGLPQRFELNLTKIYSDIQLISIVSLKPTFIIREPNEDDYKIVIRAINDKGPSAVVELVKEDIVNSTLGNEVKISAVTNITTLALALCGGVALIALAACGLVLCAQERSTRTQAARSLDPPLCAYNTDGDIVTVSKSSYDIYSDSDESECNVRRTESFRRAVARYPSKNFDVKKSNSFHSARYMDDAPEPESKFNDILRHNTNCRVHSLQNISRKREMDTLCDHLVMRLPRETNYQVAKPMNTFYTMPRKIKSKSREISDETSEITQASDFSFPPPPDEFGTYRAATRIKDVPTKSTPTYSTVRKNSTGKDAQKQQFNSGNPSMNTVGLPVISGQHNSVYSYPDDDHHHHHTSTNPFGEES